MLEKRDLEMIAQVVGEIIRPVNARLDKIDAKLDKVEERLDKVDARLDKMDARLGNAEERLDKMDAKLGKLEEKVTEVQMTLENVTNKEIHIIAEGHLDLSRKLNDALKVENEKEMLLIRVTHLEHEVGRIKQKIGVTA